MKFTALCLGLLMSSVSFASDFSYSNLPTATKSYSDVVYSDADAEVAKVLMQSQCLAEKADAEATILQSRAKILSSTGCKVKVYNTLTDQTWEGIQLSTGFTVIFK
jgi:hypothetical protein